MLRFQASLPHLPVPTLSSTAAKYLDDRSPTSHAFRVCGNGAHLFLPSSARLSLLSFSKDFRRVPVSQRSRDWLADWWNDVAYMAYRDPVVVFVSYFFVHLDDELRRNQASRAVHS